MQKYQSIVDAEWDIIYDKLDKIAASGSQIVLSRLAIGDLATQYFADRNIFCAGRVPIDVRFQSLNFNFCLLVLGFYSCTSSCCCLCFLMSTISFHADDENAVELVLLEFVKLEIRNTNFSGTDLQDLVRVSLACGGVVQTSITSLTPDVLGSCGRFEERQIGQERYNILTECPKVKSSPHSWSPEIATILYAH